MIKKSKIINWFKKNISLIVLSGVFFIFSLFTGCFPVSTVPNTGISYDMIFSPYTDGFHRSDYLYPYGVYYNESFSLVLVQELISFFISNAAVIYSVMSFIIFLISFFSIYFILCQLTTNKIIRILGVILWFICPYLSAQTGIPPVFYGLLLLPLCFSVDYLIYKYLYLNDCRHQFYWPILICLMRLFIVAAGWYYGVISATASCLFWLFLQMADAIKYKHFKILFLLGHIIMPWAFACALVYSLTPKDITSYTSSLEFINGSSVDLATIVLPAPQQFIGRWYSYKNLLPEQNHFTGDNTMWHNYLGWSMIFVIIFAFTKFRRRIPRELNILLLITLIILIISLGPCLKFLASTTLITGTYDSYLLPIDDLIKFPWYRIFELLPFSMMRANYRWFGLVIFFHILLFIKSFDLIYNFYSKKTTKKNSRLFMFTIFCLSIMAYYPREGISKQISSKITRMSNINTITTDVVSEIDSATIDGARTVFLAYDYSNNGFVIPYLTSQAHITTYSGAGDKSMATASKYKPRIVSELENSGDPEIIAYLTTQVLEKDLSDYIIMPFYALRENSSVWPPSEKIARHTREIAYSAISHLDKDLYQIFEGDWQLIVSRKQVKPVSKNIIDNLEDHKVHTKNPLFGNHEAIQLAAHEEVEKEFVIDDGYDELYLQAYFADDDDKTAEIVIEQYDTQKIEEVTIVLDRSNDYQFVEKEIRLAPDAKRVKVSLINNNDLPLEVKKVTVTLVNTANYYYKSDFHDPETLEIQGRSGLHGEKLAVGFELHDEHKNESKDYTLMKMMDNWCSEMTFYIGSKERYYLVTISGDGQTPYNYWIDKEMVADNAKFELQYDHGKYSLIIDDHELLNTDLEFKNVYISDLPVIVGSDFDGRISNLLVEIN